MNFTDSSSKPTASTQHSHADQQERIFSHSSMASFRRCMVQYFWKYVKGYAPQPSIGRIRGTLGHTALGTWYKDHDEDLSLKAASNELTNIELKYDADYSGEWEFLAQIFKRFPLTRTDKIK